VGNWNRWFPSHISSSFFPFKIASELTFATITITLRQWSRGVAARVFDSEPFPPPTPPPPLPQARELTGIFPSASRARSNDKLANEWRFDSTKSEKRTTNTSKIEWMKAKSLVGERKEEKLTEMRERIDGICP